MGRRRKPKVFEGIDIIDIGHRGKCVGKTTEGEIVMVEGAVPGDRISGIALKKKKGLWQVKPQSFLAYSEDRETPRCQHFELCGGCKWQHLSMDRQLYFKEKQVRETMRRLGEQTDYNFESIVPSPKIYEFRNKMEFSFAESRWLSDDEIAADATIENNGGLGLHPPGWFQKVVDIETCHLIPDEINTIRNFIRENARALNLTFYNPVKHVGDMRNLIFRINRKGEMMLVVIFGSPMTTKHEELLQKIQSSFASIISLYVVINQKANDSIYDLPATLIHGAEYLNESIGSIEFYIGPKSFFQTNIYQTEQLYAEVKRLAQLTGEEVVYDLYSGIGSIALYVADQVKELWAVEDVAAAVDDARLNAAHNKIDHVTYFTGKMEKIIETENLDAWPDPDVIITDPPRAGMHKDVVEFILRKQPKRIVYVSCDPSTQARDVKLLAEKYKLVSLQPFDMFPHTSHIEAVALLELA